MKTEKETALNIALREYQIERPKMKFWTWCKYYCQDDYFTEEEKVEAKEISKTLKV